MNNPEKQTTTDGHASVLAVAPGSAARHPGHIGYAYATAPGAEQVIGLFETREEAIANLFSDDPNGGWISAVRAVTEDDEGAEEGWDFICYGARETVSPNTLLGDTERHEKT